ncbi:MAG: dihydropteroate synthase [Sulfurimonas sp.]|nr:dihydropteroate synthase [Sulfurimonadaceae bacterium]
MQVEILNANIDIKKYLKDLKVDSGGVSILASKAKLHILHIKDMSIGAANILKQDALSIGADLAVPRGTVNAKLERVDALLIATTKHLKLLSKKELAQPFGLKEFAHKLSEILKISRADEPIIMGIINATDDSFYSGSRFLHKDSISKIISMIEDGASIIDIGAISSAPSSKAVSVGEEIARLKPLLRAIKTQRLYEKVRFSIDSYEPKAIKLALDSGFSIVNDITGLADDEVAKLCATYSATAIIMHMQGTPQTMQLNPQYENILSDIYSFFEARVAKAESFGIKDIVLDVGIGFGKTLEHNLKLISHLEHFKTLGKELLVGASRKSMINKITPSAPQDRLAGSIVLHMEAIKNGASIIRVHDVYEHKQALEVLKSLKTV